MTRMPLPFAQLGLGLAVAAIVAVAAVLGVRYWRRREAAREQLRKVGAIAYDMVRDVLVPDGNEGQMHLDFVLLTASGMLVVDLRDVPGVIFGSESMDEWTVMDGPRRRTFPNPLGPLYDRIAAVKLVAGRVPVDGRVVFTARASFPKGQPPRVSMIEALQSEFPLADRGLDPSPIAGWAEEWQALRAVSVPSPLARRG